MKVLHISFDDPNRPGGGEGVAVKGITDEQNKMGIYTNVIAFDVTQPQGYLEEKPLSKVMIVNTEPNRPNFTDMWYHQLVWSRMILALCKEWKNEKIDIIHLHDSWLWPVAEAAEALYGCKIVYTCHLSFTVENWGNSRWDNMASEEGQMEATALMKSYTTFVSLPYAQKIIQQYALDMIMPSRPSAVINNGVSPLDNTQEVRLKGKKNIYFCARAVPTKGIQLVVQAAERLPDYNFHVFSFVREEQKGLTQWGRYLESADILLENFHWHRFHTQAEKCAYLRACDIALVPSTNAAPFEITGLEAMISGTPLITTAICGMRDYCTDENSTIIEPTVEALVAAISGHKKDKKKIQAALNTARNFTWEKAAKQYVKFYEVVYGDDLQIKHAA